MEEKFDSEKPENRAERAVQLFKEGFNCSQAVFGAFCDRYNIDLDTAMKLSASFGGGMGRMREVCGAVSGMFLVAGLETGSSDGRDREAKQRNYEIVQKLAKAYREETGSIICRELLGHGSAADMQGDSAVPSERTDAYYKKRPCVKLVELAAELLESELFQKAEDLDDGINT